MALKVAELDPAAIVTVVGTVSVGLVLARVTVAALAAARFKLTVHVVESLLPKIEGAQDIPVSCAGGVALRPNVCEPPFKLAVICAV